LAAARAEIDKIQSILFRARQAPTAIVIAFNLADNQCSLGFFAS
jgi:hypothetical protein